jgi:hypothetical protein
MKPSAFSVVLLANLCCRLLSTAAVPVQVEAAGGEVILRFDLPSGVTVQAQKSSDFQSWADVGQTVTGTDQVEELRLGREAVAAAFFRLLEVQAGVAPTPEQFEQQIVGTTFAGYEFTSGTRFDWFGETGNWVYTKTGPDEGGLVFTYDEDGNDPAVYREEIVLTFETPTTGTFRYSEYNFGFEDATSVTTGPFAL